MRLTRISRVIAGITLLGALSGWTSTPKPLRPKPAPRFDVASLREELTDVLHSAAGRWSMARWSVLAVSLDRGDTLFAESPGEALAPASNMKLMTTAAAMDELGPNYRYHTYLMTSGPVVGGRLQGDLILYGTGDPSISNRFQRSTTTVLEEFADSLAALGVSVIEGDLVGDGSYFSGPLLGVGWNPDDLNDWFTAPSSGLALNENVFTLRVHGPTASDPTAHFTTLPENAGVPVLNQMSIGTGPLLVRRSDPSQPILVQGHMSAGREIWREMTVQDPAHFAASVFAKVLEDRGIHLVGSVRAAHTAAESQVTGRRVWAPALQKSPTRVVAQHVSPPLSEIIAVVNKRSHNLLADYVLKTLGRVTLGDGSFEGGSRAVRQFLASRVGVDTAHVSIHDGSGLSDLNRVSAADFVSVVSYMAARPVWDDFWETLPEAGNPHELRRMYATPAAGNLRAKTGTIEHVSALSGMVTAANGERIAFSILSNQVPSTSAAKRLEDQIGSRLASFERPALAGEPTAEPATDSATVVAKPGGDR